MPRQNLLISFFFILLFFCGKQLMAQIVATPSVGCVPLSVQFSGPPNASNIYWTLGAGMGSSQLPNPSQLYTNAGTYNITYTAMVSGNPVMYSTQVVVTGGPSGSFSFAVSPNGCAPRTVSLSGTGGAPGSSYTWAFGDLTPVSPGSSATHTYVLPGTFVPVMIVLDAVTGCTSMATNNTGTVYVSSPPNLVISSSNGFSGCVPPFITAFSGSASASGSPLGGGLTYNWQFVAGNPGSGTGVSPPAVTFGLGLHSVTLAATDNNNCSNTITANVAVLDPTLSVVTQPTICMGEVVVATVSSSESNVFFNFSSATPLYTQTNIAVGIPQTCDSICIFANPGPNTLSTSIYPGNGCPPVSTVVPIFVEYIAADFTLTPVHSTCDPTMQATYINLSTVNTSATLSYTWMLDGGDATNNGFPSPLYVANPTFTYVQGSLNPYTIYENWIPRVILFVESNSIANCKASINYELYDTIRRPTAWFNTDKKQGCAPLTVTFRDTSFTNPNYAITGYTLYNGASPPLSVSGSSNIFPYAFTYTAVGTYTPYMIIETAQGCRDTSFVDTLVVSSPPTLNMSLATSSTCAGQSVTVNMSASPPGVVNHWHATSDNSFFSGCVTNPNPSFPFTHVGVHGFSVTGYQNGCQGSMVSSQSITVRGPYGSLRYRTNCTPGSRKTVSFSMLLQEVENATLNFGDNSSMAITGNAVGSIPYMTSHTYSATGNYTAILTCSNSVSGCSVTTHSVVVTVREIQARITYSNQPLPTLPNALGCANRAFVFSGASSVDALVSCGRGYNWMMRTQTDSVRPPNPASPLFTTDTLTAASLYTLSLSVKDINNCSDTAVVVFRVSDPTPSFSFNANPICADNPSVQIINNTQGTQYPPDYITNYVWDFGDGSPQLITSNATLNPVHTYSGSASPFQVYNVISTASNNVGCLSTFQRTLQINNPIADFKTSHLFPCLPKYGSATVTFSAGTGFSTYSVNYADPPNAGWQTTSSFNNAFHTYTTPGVYVATLTVIDNAGCRASENKTITVIGQPTATIGFPDNNNKFCVLSTPSINAVVNIHQSPVTNTLWTLDLGNGPVTSPPPGYPVFNSYTFPESGIYTLTLTVNVGGLCASSVTTDIIVADPKAELKLNKNVFCLNDTIKVSIRHDSSQVAGWRWFFGDNVPQQDIYAGSVLALFNPTASYVYSIFPSDSTGKAVLSLRYFGMMGACPRTSTTDIQVLRINSGFIHQQDNYRHCLNIKDEFVSVTRNPMGLSYIYQWDFGDNTTGSGSPVSHTYQQPGVYPVILTVRDANYNCPDTSKRTMTILPLPEALLSVEPGTVCPGTSFTLTGSGKPGVSGNVTGTVTPGEAVNMLAGNSFTMTTSAALTTTYALQVTDSNLCVSKPATTVINIVKPLTDVRWDTTVIAGVQIPINAFMGSSYSYSWTPEVSNLNCDSCYNPVSTTTVNITYSVQVTDEPLRCFVNINTYRIFIDPRTSLDVPSAFTPNGDGVNDRIYADGWGVRELKYFRIFNRWGQLLFETNDLKTGWDGTFAGVPQNMETYVYQVSATTYTDEDIEKKGTFKLLR